MDVERLRQLRRAFPWKPYMLILQDGRKLLVDQPPYMGVSPNGRLVLVATEGDHVERLRPEYIKDAVLLEEMDRPVTPTPPQAREPG